MPRFIEILDTTLRDGEQTQGVSLPPPEKLTIARALLTRLRVDRVEVASARVSPGEQRGLSRIVAWARARRLVGRVEVLGFTDRTLSVDWIREAGGEVINLLTKGSLRHLEGQLRKTPDEHLKDVEATLAYARRKGLRANIYLEDWSNGMRSSGDYVRHMLERYAAMPFERILLPDTLGILAPGEVENFIGEIAGRWPKVHFDFHGHNDYGLATANSLAAIKAGARGVHATVNGLGERAGNTSLDELVVGIHDHLGLLTRVDEKELKPVSRLVEAFSGRRIAANKPVTGESVFTHTAGIHADGDKKGRLYTSRLDPVRFGQTRSYAMGKLAGKASIELNLRETLKSLNIDLAPDEIEKVRNRVVDLGDHKKTVTPEDLPFIISDVLESPEYQNFEIKDCVVMTSKGVSPTAVVRARVGKAEREASATGDGGYDAFMNALGKILDEFRIPMPKLVDYEVRIPPGGKTDALVETRITWEGGRQTRGVNSDQVLAAVQATENMLNCLLLEKQRKKTRKEGSRK